MTARLKTEFPDADDSPGLLLWRLTNAWQAAQRSALAPLGLTHVQFVLLASLTWLDPAGPPTQRDLARHAGTDPMMTSQVLRALEDKGLVLRGPHPTDARARALSVTEEGARAANRAVAVVEQVDRRFFGRLGGRSAGFTAMLRTLLEAEPGGVGEVEETG